jgi:hypothetical protein
MTRRWVRVGMRSLAAMSVVTLVAAVPDLATADSPNTKTEYDGEATALTTSGLSLTLFPADQKLPPQFSDIPRPEETTINLAPAAVGVPTQAGHAEYRGSDEVGALPSNPLLSGGMLLASSTKVGTRVVSEAEIGHLDIGGGALTLDNIVARCSGNGDDISLSAPLATAGGQTPLQGQIDIEPNTATPVPGVGTITWNDHVSDSATYGEVSNLVIDLQTNLDADVLQDIPEAMAAFENVVQQVLMDLNKAGKDVGFPTDQIPSLTGQQLYDTLDDVLAQVPTDQLPDLNPLLELSGSITLANAACSQKVVNVPINRPPPNHGHNNPPGESPPGNDDTAPPLADTGASAWPARAGLVGLVALGLGGCLALRRRATDAGNL